MSSKLRVQELRDELSKRGLDTAGLQPTLITRLDEAIASEVRSPKATTKDEEAAPQTTEKNEKTNGKRKSHLRDEDTDASVKRLKVEDVNKSMNSKLP